ncbi:hypothetical protein GQX74_000335 [Glossina fuscipes]|nr:hypothetical protein GQX74_000335 [Glossina fuscipes]
MIVLPLEMRIKRSQHGKLVSNEEDTETDEYPKKLPVVENEEDINDEFHELISKKSSMGSRCVGKTMSSGIIQNEHCNGDSLQSLLQERSLVESELKLLLLYVAEGLRYIHSNDLVHRDLKSEIIFFTKMPPGHKSPMPPSSPRQPDPNSMDDSTLLLPVLSTAQSRKT